MMQGMKMLRILKTKRVREKKVLLKKKKSILILIL